jgi:hypothetical protein
LAIPSPGRLKLASVLSLKRSSFSAPLPLLAFASVPIVRLSAPGLTSRHSLLLVKLTVTVNVKLLQNFRPMLWISLAASPATRTVSTTFLPGITRRSTFVFVELTIAIPIKSL